MAEKELNTNPEEITNIAESTEKVSEKSGKKAAVKKAKKSDKKPNVFVRIGKRIARFWRESISELKKVVWMSGKELRKSTLLVVVSVIAISIIIGLVDYLFTIAIQGFASLNLFN